jgi:hypothetical protein
MRDIALRSSKKQIQRLQFRSIAEVLEAAFDVLMNSPDSYIELLGRKVLCAIKLRRLGEQRKLNLLLMSKAKACAAISVPLLSSPCLEEYCSVWIHERGGDLVERD